MKSKGMIATIVIGVIGMTTVLQADQGQPMQAKPAEPIQVRPLQLALVPAVQLVPEDEAIQGLRLNIYGSNERVTGVDIGLVHETHGDFSGVSFGLLSMVHGDCRGLQFSGFYNGADNYAAGLQVGIVNIAGDIHGLQIGLMNVANDMTGIQIGLWNEIKSKETLPVLPLINAAF